MSKKKRSKETEQKLKYLRCLLNMKDYLVSVYDVTQAINAELKWVYENPHENKDYLAGFVRGLEQAKIVVVKMAEAIYEDETWENKFMGEWVEPEEEENV